MIAKICILEIELVVAAAFAIINFVCRQWESFAAGSSSHPEILIVELIGKLFRLDVAWHCTATRSNGNESDRKLAVWAFQHLFSKQDFNSILSELGLV